MDDSQIVELYLSRDESAITQTSQKYGTKLKRIAQNVLSDAETSKESEAVATEESLATESADSDYPAMVMYDGAVYKDSGEEFIGEILEDGLLQVSSYTDGEPSENGQQNFDRSSETKFFILNEDAIVVCIDPNEGIWRIFLKQ